MSWLNTMLSAANLGMEIIQVTQLNDLVQQDEDSKAVKEIYRLLRNQLINYNMAAKEILAQEEVDLKIRAGAMRVLELRLLDSVITPEIFYDTVDIEKAHETYKLIQDSSAELRNSLSLEDSYEIDDMANSALLIPKYGYYIENHDQLIEYNDAKSESDRLGFLSKFAVEKGLGCVAFIAFFAIVFAFGYLFSNNILFGFVIGAVIGLGGILWFRSQVSKSKAAKKKMEELDQELDLELLFELDNKFNGDINKAKDAEQSAEFQVMQFFANTPLLPI